MERLDVEHYLVEFWDEDRWALDTSTGNLEEARAAYKKLRALKRRARLTKVLEMGWE